jgi:hypothetical protein
MLTLAPQICLSNTNLRDQNCSFEALLYFRNSIDEVILKTADRPGRRRLRADVFNGHARFKNCGPCLKFYQKPGRLREARPWTAALPAVAIKIPMRFAISEVRRPAHTQNEGGEIS